MDSRIEELLEKYWKCETTLEEEQSLKDYFAANDVPENLKETANLFQYFALQKGVTLPDAGFDRNVKKKIKLTTPDGKVVRMMFNTVRIAAGILVVVAATYFIRQEVRKTYPQEIVDTYTDPKLAFEETKKALMMISKGFGKAQREAEKIKIFNEAEQKIQHVADDDKEQSKDKSSI